MSLYGRLFRYRARPDREPLEDFLTEALADLLTRMPRGAISSLLQSAFRSSLSRKFLDILGSAELDWRTQVAANGGIADLVLFADGKPMLVVENKTWSGFQDHSTDEQQANQITTYCRWLSEQSTMPESCAVLLLTGTTAFPEGFHRDDGHYDIACRGQITWAALGRWFAALIAGDDEPCTWKQLARELIAFLGERNLSSEIFTAADVSAAHLFLPTRERWNATFSSIWAGSEHLWRSFLSSRVSPLDLNSEAGMIWQWRYVAADNKQGKVWVGLGLRFPDQSEWYVDIGLPQSPHFFFVIGSDASSLRHPDELPSGWLRNDDDGEFLTYLPLSDLPSNVDEKLQKLSDWSKLVIPQCQAIIREAAG